MRPSEILAAKADEIREIIARYPVRNPRIFGSAARGDDAEGSDLDLLVEFLPGRRVSLFTLGGMIMELRDLTGLAVDLRTVNDLSKYFRDKVLREAKLLYVA